LNAARSVRSLTYSVVSDHDVEAQPEVSYYNHSEGSVFLTMRRPRCTSELVSAGSALARFHGPPTVKNEVLRIAFLKRFHPCCNCWNPHK
jgi:hypothetical protein